ncbi:MAG: DUF5076 domain-containing protein [Xanthobacteraceae bacterium]
MSEIYKPLSVPPAANDRGGVEILRCAVIDGELHMTFRPAFTEPNGWGQLFAEVARQVAQAYAHDKRFSESETFTRIASAFDADMKRPPDMNRKIAPIGSS